MKHMFGAAALAVGAFVVACFGMTQVAEAGSVTIESSNGSTGGGEFKVSTFSGLTLDPIGANVNQSGSLFKTFCLERTEGLSYNTLYNVDFGSTSIGGGATGQDTNGNTEDSLDARTAWLYTQFWNGTLTGGVGFAYDYTGATRQASANALQLAIWKIEGELSGPGVTDITASYTSNTLAQKFYDASAGASGVGNVKVMNLTLNGQRAQSLLVIGVPLPSAAWLGLGMMSVLGAVGVVRRRRRQALV